MPIERKTYNEIVDLFARGASSAEVLAFKPSLEAKKRVRMIFVAAIASYIPARRATKS